MAGVLFSLHQISGSTVESALLVPLAGSCCVRLLCRILPAPSSLFYHIHVFSIHPLQQAGCSTPTLLYPSPSLYPLWWISRRKWVDLLSLCRTRDPMWKREKRNRSSPRSWAVATAFHQWQAPNKWVRLKASWHLRRSPIHFGGETRKYIFFLWHRFHLICLLTTADLT